MMKKYIQVIVVFVMLAQFVFPGSSYVEARKNDTKQPETCNWPSEMMSYYFDFQNEAITILLWSKVNSKLFSASFDNWWLFTTKALTLKWTTAIDFLASNVVWSVKSFVSNSITSMVLLILASKSALRSNTEWLAILFKDRPIVRDYKQMLDIETTLFDVAFFRSKQIDLTRPFESDLLKELDVLIKKYQWLGLLETWGKVKESGTMANILYDLVEMNAAMKHFIMIGGKLWKKWLRNYNWCFWDQEPGKCTRSVSILKFSDEAIETLNEDYKDVRTYWKCNSYKASLDATINKTINNNINSVKTATKDVELSIKRLKWALMWSYDWKKRESRCDMTDYEMAQLQAYWWWDWTCSESIVNFDVSVPLLKSRKYFNQKKIQMKQKEKAESVLKKADKPESKDFIIWDVTEKLKSKSTNQERTQLWYKIYGKDSNYNSDFSFDLDSEFFEVFQYTMDQYSQAQENWIAADVSDLFPRGKWLLDQMDTTIKNTDELEKNLQHIEDKQCTG